MRVVDSSPLANHGQHLFARTEEHDTQFPSLFPLPSFLKSLHLKDEQVPSGNALFGLALCLQPSAGLDNACTVGNQIVPTSKCLSKSLILLCRIIRVGIDGIYERLALRNQTKFCLRANDIESLK